ncbi:MAG: hypothetical protein H7250_00840 [Flavobacterium sp.]|nr:hypothetical protein [Flavobacterium sp.]
MEKDLVAKIVEIENKFAILKPYLEKHHEFRGLINIQSKICRKPEILFIGINPGQGAFIKMNYQKKDVKFPNGLLSNPFHFDNLDLDWLKFDNARKEGAWFEKNKNVNNPFPKKMLDILFNIYEGKFGKIDFKNIKIQENFINEIANKIVYTNICPIATKDENELKKIYKKLFKEEKLNNHWNDGTIKNFFRQKTIDLILELQPKLIVCIGFSVYKDLFLAETSKKEKVFYTKSSFKRQNLEYSFPTVTFSRKGAWNIKEISKLIMETRI